MRKDGRCSSSWAKATRTQLPTRQLQRSAFDSGGVCSMGPHFVYGMWHVLGSILGVHGMKLRLG